ncbi:hypothetical protein SDC9_136542 [bioreactor metagenome]|uniref:Uncharacterized protein n=1 Tax=bioreactor metagenome TaxID=1076179 RepID=A0A645DKU3_9ZZZZ
MKKHTIYSITCIRKTPEDKLTTKCVVRNIHIIIPQTIVGISPPRYETIIIANTLKSNKVVVSCILIVYIIIKIPNNPPPIPSMIFPIKLLISSSDISFNK